MRGWGFVAALATAASLAGAVVVSRSGGLLSGRSGLLAVLAATVATSLVAGLAATRAGWGGAFVLVLAALALVPGLTVGPKLSDDLYRYQWDARVASSGVADVYAYPPVAPELSRLRDGYLFPPLAVCEQPRSQRPALNRTDPFLHADHGGCTAMNFPLSKTVYPPVAELDFRAIRAVLPTRWHEREVQVAAALESLAVTGLLLLVLARARRPAGIALAYSLGPLATVEAAMDGHVDVLAALLVLAAVLVHPRGRSTLRAAATGLLLGAAVLVKLYPALPALPFLRDGPRRQRVVVVASGVVLGALLYLPHVLREGTKVLGYIPGYLHDNGYGNGDRYLLLKALGLSSVAVPLVVAGLVLAVVWVFVAPPRREAREAVLCGRAAAVLGVAFLLASPGNAWYLATLTVLSLVARRYEWLLLIVANYVVYFSALLHWGHAAPEAAYAVTAVVAAGGALWRWYDGDRDVRGLSWATA